MDRHPVKAAPEAQRAPVPSAPMAAKPPAIPTPPVQVIAPKPIASTPQPAPAQPKPEPPVPSVQPAPAPPPVATDNAASEISLANDGVAYLLKPADVVQISLRGIPAAEGIEGVIDEHGMISLPFINEVMAAGQTASDLARNIRQMYMDQGIYKNISVTVVVPTHYYFIQGEIRGPGRFQIVSTMRVSQAIAAAGGYTEYASGQVVVKRGGKIVKTIRNARRLERTPEDDILLEPDDIIEVRRSLW
jgi:protein involved in polysaccharide export with SLBB domain